MIPNFMWLTEQLSLRPSLSVLSVPVLVALAIERADAGQFNVKQLSGRLARPASDIEPVLAEMLDAGLVARTRASYKLTEQASLFFDGSRNRRLVRAHDWWQQRYVETGVHPFSSAFSEARPRPTKAQEKYLETFEAMGWVGGFCSAKAPRKRA